LPFFYEASTLSTRPETQPYSPYADEALTPARFRIKAAGSKSTVTEAT
jgi:hypothetical protein